jgi:MATE family multidrug resistance protein
VRRELGPLLRLATPVILAEIGWMAMGLVDTLMVGPLGPAAIGAVGLGSTVFFTVAVFGMGLMLGLDALVAQSFGAGRLDDCVRWLQHGTLLALAAAPPLMLLSLGAFLTVDAWGLHPDVLALALPYMRIVVLGTLPLLLYAAFRRYLQGVHLMRPILYALVTANLVNVAANWTFIYGHLGVAPLGVPGSAWATNLARTYMAAFIGVAILLEHRRRRSDHPRVPFVYEPLRLWRLLRLGTPAAAQVTLELGVFAAVSALAGRLDPTSLASHQIAVNIAALAFMVPLGLSSAAAVRVGHAIGAGHPARAVQAGWAAFAAGLAITAAVAVAFLTTPAIMLRPFTGDASVVALGVRLLAIAAAFQLFDGTQAVATGVLRGVGDTRTPLAMNLLGHWVLGLPAGYALCFWSGWGVAGLWVGLSIGLTVAAVTLTMAWLRHARRLLHGDGTGYEAASAVSPK